MKDCTDDKCIFKKIEHIHFKDESLDIFENDSYTFILDRKENSYMRISKLNKEFIKYWPEKEFEDATCKREESSE